MRNSNFSKESSLWFNSLAGVCQNLSAAWFGIILVSPGMAIFIRTDAFLLLTKLLLFGILFLYLSVKFAKLSK